MVQITDTTVKTANIRWLPNPGITNSKMKKMYNNFVVLHS